MNNVYKKEVKTEYGAGLFYVFFKKHYCPKCGKKMERAYKSRTVNARSPEAKDHRVNFGEKVISSDIEYRTGYLHCGSCQFSCLFQEMKRYEKEKKERY